MESRTIGKRMVWQGRQGRVQLCLWEFKRVRANQVVVECAAVLDVGSGPGVWLNVHEVTDVRALLDRIANAPERKESNSLDHVAQEAADLLFVHERVAVDQRVLQVARVLETGIRFRQEPPTDASTRAAWADVKLPVDYQQHNTDIVCAINERIKHPESPSAQADAENVRAAMAQARDDTAYHLSPSHTTSMPGQDNDGDEHWPTIIRQDETHDIDILTWPAEEQDRARQDPMPLWTRFERRPYVPHKRKQPWKPAYRPLTQRENYATQR
jgi:hypothetical protein